ncbi:MAG: hypothetical protein ACI9TO_000436 [Rickettsiales bacterium]|jgi:hypothetical protein
MTEIGFNIKSWSAFAPELNSEQDWQDWANNEKSISSDFSLTPRVDFLPPLHRRRLSQLTKMSLRAAYDCAYNYQNYESVFASRYGELAQTVKLLQSILSKEELSPAGFSLSVHNTSAGLYSLTQKNNAPYTAIAASELTFEAALIESVGRLQNVQYVLLVVGEEDVPELSGETPPFAVAFLLEKGQDFIIKPSNQENIQSENLSLDFLKWFLRNERTFQTNLYQINCHAKEK